MLKCILLQIFCCFGTCLFAQDLDEAGPASSGTWSRIFHSPAAALINPAALGTAAPASIILFSKRPYLVKDLSVVHLLASYPLTGRNNVFLGCQRFGHPNFSELTLSLGYGIQLSKMIQVGIATHGSISKVNGYLKSLALLPAFSIQYGNERFISGFFLQYGIYPVGEIPQRYWRAGVGIGRDWSDQLYTDLTIYYNYNAVLNIMASLQYQVLSAWCLVLRVQTQPFRYSFETGYQKNRFSVRICSDWHPQLGFSPGLLLSYKANSSNKTNVAGIIY